MTRIFELIVIAVFFIALLYVGNVLDRKLHKMSGQYLRRKRGFPDKDGGGK